jgi:predicted site-specific integrase-resolvase
MHDDRGMQEPVELIDTAEAAEILEKNRSTVTRWAQTGRLPYVKKANGLRGSLMFDRAVIEARRQS